MARYRKGDIVEVSPDNDNEGYNSFRGHRLRIIHVARSEKDHPGYDSALKGEGLYDFVDLDTGKHVGSSLYDYELVKSRRKEPLEKGVASMERMK